MSVCEVLLRFVDLTALALRGCGEPHVTLSSNVWLLSTSAAAQLVTCVGRTAHRLSSITHRCCLARRLERCRLSGVAAPSSETLTSIQPCSMGPASLSQGDLDYVFPGTGNPQARILWIPCSVPGFQN